MRARAMAVAVDIVAGRVGQLEVLMATVQQAGNELNGRTSVVEKMMKEVKDYKDDLERRLAAGSERVVTKEMMVARLMEQKMETSREMTKMFGECMKGLNDVRAKVEAMEATNGGHNYGGGKGGGGLVDAKHMIPEVFDGKDEAWNKWKESVEEYVKMKDRGVWVKMNSVKDTEEEIGDEFEGNEGEMLMSLLQLKAKGEAERIVKGVRASRGLEAWRRLLRY